MYRLGASIAAQVAERTHVLHAQSGIPLRLLDREPELALPSAISIPFARLTAEPPRLMVGSDERSLQHRADLLDLEHSHDDLAGYFRLFQAGLPMSIGDGLAWARRAPA